MASDADRATGQARVDATIAADGDDTAATRRALAQFIAAHADELLGVLRTYVYRFGLAAGEDVSAVATEVFQELTAQALASAARFDPGRSPMAWLLGIALNVIRRRRSEEQQRRRRERLESTLFRDTDGDSGRDDLEAGSTTAQWLVSATPGPEDALAAADEAETLLALVAPEDAQVLRLALLEDCDGETLARQLGTTPGTARMRLHRALGRLRAAWNAEQQAAADEGGQR